MKLWIDDQLCPPDDSWTWVTDAAAALALVAHSYLSQNPTHHIEVISFDHDLGGDENTMPVAQMIEVMADAGHKPPAWQIHSGNTPGRMNLEAALRSADRLWAAEDNPGAKR